jgi:hypothetical protein
MGKRIKVLVVESRKNKNKVIYGCNFEIFSYGKITWKKVSWNAPFNKK